MSKQTIKKSFMNNFEKEIEKESSMSSGLACEILGEIVIQIIDSDLALFELCNSESYKNSGVHADILAIKKLFTRKRLEEMKKRSLNKAYQGKIKIDSKWVNQLVEERMYTAFIIQQALLHVILPENLQNMVTLKEQVDNILAIFKKEFPEASKLYGNNYLIGFIGSRIIRFKKLYSPII